MAAHRMNVVRFLLTGPFASSFHEVSSGQNIRETRCISGLLGVDRSVFCPCRFDITTETNPLSVLSIVLVWPFSTSGGCMNAYIPGLRTGLDTSSCVSWDSNNRFSLNRRRFSVVIHPWRKDVNKIRTLHHWWHPLISDTSWFLACFHRCQSAWLQHYLAHPGLF